MEMIGFVGLGTIGGVVAGNIQKAGYPMMVRDILPEASEPLVARGAQRAASAAEVARQCRIVFTSLPGPREVAEVALGAHGLLHGVHENSIYVDLSSSSADLIADIAAQFRQQGGRVMDAPLIVGKQGIANRSVQVLASGPADAYEEVKPLFDAFSDTVVYTGKLGTGTIIKLAHNLVRRSIGLAIGEGLVLGAKAGVDPSFFGNVCTGVWTLNCSNWEKRWTELCSPEIMISPLVSALVYRAKTSVSPPSWAANIMCPCPSLRWSSK